MILLTGATGKTGSATAIELSNLNVPFRALIRSEEKRAQIEALGGEVIIGSAEDRETIDQAMIGVEKLLIILPNCENQLEMETQLVDSAKIEGVQHIVYMSSVEADEECSSPIPKLHWDTEVYIKNSGMHWTMIKPNFYMQNFIGSSKTIVEQNKFFLPMSEGKTGMIDTRDVGKVIAKVLSEEGHEGQSYQITGPEILSFYDVAEKFSSVLKREVLYIDMPIDAYKNILSQFLTNQWHLDSVIDLFGGIAEGGIEYKTDTFEDLIGAPPRSLEDFIEEHRSLYTA
ncbi:MAG: SDR family oxidoreductase [Gammaproteobacteria bacterium]|nr:SDR family oxidoreductase [Gammaproteobacteria bacterium]